MSSLLAIIIGIAAGTSPGDVAESAAFEPSVEEQRVLAAEDEYVVAEIHRDEPTLRRLIDARFVLNSGDGSTSGREDFIQAILSNNMLDQTIRERSVLVERDIAFVFGTADLRLAQADKTEIALSLRYTSTYAKRDGRWRMLVLQMQRRVPH